MTDLSPDVQGLLDESYKSDLTEEESEELLLLCGHGIGPKLSPAAQAVLDAYRDLSWTPDEEDNSRYYKFSHRDGMAAALRAAADQMSAHQSKKFLCSIADCLKLNAIAAELEGNG